MFSRVSSGKAGSVLMLCADLLAASITADQLINLSVNPRAFGCMSTQRASGALDPAQQVHSELAALRAAGISYELVPGVSSALAAPLAAGGRHCQGAAAWRPAWPA